MRSAERAAHLFGAWLSLVLVLSQAAPVRAVAPRTSPLNTPWTASAVPAVPLPEYPRPQMTRPDWMNLNGEWQFRQSTTNDAPVFGQVLPERINVPFPPESALSGIMRAPNDNRYYVFYRRTFTIPAGWAGRRVQLYLQACDNQCWVWINGVQVASHLGGYDRIDADITGQLNGGTNEIIVKAFDPSDTRINGTLPAVGKQTVTPNSIWYTPSTGIWQTVWLEPTPASSISSVDFYPRLSDSVLRVRPFSRGDVTGHTVLAEAMVGGTVVGSAVGGFAEFTVPVPNARLWSPDDPYLYNLRVTLRNASGATVDQTMHYFGMREVGKKTIGGRSMMTLNGRVVFNVGTLDQGFWPDGVYTAPTDAALAFDIQAHKTLGFNMVRKHIKIEPQRWFYHADRLGLLVWQDMPSLTAQDVNANAAQLAQWEAEINQMIDEHRSSPAVVAYVIYNEGWGEVSLANTQRIAQNAKNYDPTRLINTHSGYNCCQSLGDPGNGDMMDYHIYNPTLDAPVSSGTRFSVLGEFGGIGLQVAGHQWSPHGGFQAYEWAANGTVLTDRYVGFIDQLTNLMNGRGTSASVYTEITDVEGEVNGFYTYDRQILKYDAARTNAANQAIINRSRALDPQPLVTLPLNVRRSFQVTTAGFTDRYMWRNGTNGDTQVVTAASDAATKDATTFTIRAGLANASCYSFESVPAGTYLRHAASRIVLSADDGTALMRNDATWCARRAITGNGVSFESFNFPGRYIRHRNAQLWTSAGTGYGTDHESATSFANDASWTVANPWSPGGAATPTATATATPTTRATPTPTTRPAGQGPFGGVNRTIANGAVIQAEDYDVGGPGVAFSDTTAGNASAQYRADDVDIEVTTDTGGGYNVDWTVAGEWMEYTVNTTAGTYSITARVASASTAPADFRVLLDGVALGTFATATTGGWQTWVDLTISGVNITAGTNRVFRIEVLNGNDCNLNFVRFASSGPTPTATARPTATATSRSTPTATTRATPTPTTRPRPTPTTGPGCAIGANCEAETALLGGGVVTSSLHAGYTGSGFADYQGSGTGFVEWTVNVPTAGTYNLNIRYGNGGTGDRPMSIQVNGATVVSSLSFPVTGWTSWTVRTQSASLPAGTVRIRATELPNGPNVDNLVVTSTGGAAAWVPNVAYAVGNLVTYGGSTYRCIQAHTSQVGWEPPAAPSLWALN
jgi:hypothetical protein